MDYRTLQDDHEGVNVGVNAGFDRRRRSTTESTDAYATASPTPLGKSFSSIFVVHDALESARMQYGNVNTLKSRLQQYFLESIQTSFRIRCFNLFIKLLSCVLYVARVIQDDGTIDTVHQPDYLEGEIKYLKLMWVQRNDVLWMAQVSVAIFSIIQTVILFYLSYRGSIFRLLLSGIFLLELFTSVPLIATIFVSKWRDLYVPIFLNCWLANKAFEAIINDYNRSVPGINATLFRQLLVLMSFLVCVLFTGMCVMEHLERAGDKPIDLFTSFYFIIVTFSTVGYGDISPAWWMPRCAVIILIICVAVVLPQQMSELAQSFVERQKSGGSFAGDQSEMMKHVVLTITHLEAGFIEDFLTEFFAHPEHETHVVVLLSPCEMDSPMKTLLKIPLWSDRVVYVRGSALKNEDLERAQITTAKACFILSARHIQKKNRSDEHTVLRSWAVKDFAPHVPQYIQIFRPETRMHLEHADFIVCEDEIKYSMLANNCICPGISTFITLIMHTSRGKEGQKSSEPWHKVYGFHSGNEIYDITIGESKFFSEFIGKSFTYASFHAHTMYGVGLLGVKSQGPNQRIRLNPGHGCLLQPTDTAYYMALTNEESLYNFKKEMKVLQRKANIATTVANVGIAAMEVPKLESSEPKKKKRLKKSKGVEVDEVNLLEVPSNNGNRRKPSIGMVADDTIEVDSDESEEEDLPSKCTQCKGTCIEELVRRSSPAVSSYLGSGFAICHMLKQKRPICCLEISTCCDHCPFSAACQYDWTNPAIIVAADRTCSGMFNLIVPLRAYYRPVHSLQPIILLLQLDDDEEKRPSDAFLDVIAWFPLVFWMQGKISSLDCLLRAGVFMADSAIVVREGATFEEEHLADCGTIVTVQKIHSLFPKLRIITELTHSSNMRFMQFDADDHYALQQSRFEQRERQRGSQMPFMFRLPFAEGTVFSASMLDRLLYQVYVKKYVVDFIRLFLGIDQSPGSGYLTCFRITEEDLWIKTYGRLYQKLCSSVADIPIGIYRTKQKDSQMVSLRLDADLFDSEKQEELTSRKERRKIEISNVIRLRMNNLGMQNEYEYHKREKKLSFVIINPSFDMELETGDLIYVLRAPVSTDADHKRVNPRRGLRRRPLLGALVSRLQSPDAADTPTRGSSTGWSEE